MKRTLKTTAIATLFSVMGLAGITLLARTNIANAESPAMAELAVDQGKERDDDDDDYGETEATLSIEDLNGVISPGEAAAIALTAATGDVEEIELENEAGRLVYEVELTTAEVTVDAQTGEVLAVEADNDDD